MIFIFFDRKQWCDFLEVIPHSSTQLSVIGSYQKHDQTILDQIKQISSWIRITRLHVDCSKVSMMFFVELIHLLPNVDSLKIIPTTASDIHDLINKEVIKFTPESRNNHITKIHIGLITDIVQVTSFIDLFSHLKYLEMNCANEIDLELLVESITMKIADCITPQLCSLCLCVGQINEEILKKFDQLMTRKIFLHDFTIKHVCDRIYFQWK